MKGSFIILSDIAASTLAIALFTFVLAFTFQGQKIEAATELELTGEINSTFNTITARPLKSSEIVTSLFDRTPQGNRDAVSIDVFDNRVELYQRKEDGTFETRQIKRDSLQFLGDLRREARTFLGKSGPIYLFVMSNELYNVSHDILQSENIRPTNVLVPAALQIREANGTRRWHPKFIALTNDDMEKAVFVDRLTTFLQAQEAAVSTKKGTANAKGQSALPSPYTPLSQRFKTFFLGLLTVTALLATLGLIFFTESRFKRDLVP